jgi:hypothetical protein
MRVGASRPSCTAPHRRTFTMHLARTVDLQPTGMLRVEGSKGSIRLTSWDRPQDDIRARIERPDHVTPEYAQQVVEATGPSNRYRGSRSRLAHRGGSGRGRAGGARRSAAHGAHRHLATRQLRQRLPYSVDVRRSAPFRGIPEWRRSGAAYRIRSRVDRITTALASARARV